VPRARGPLERLEDASLVLGSDPDPAVQWRAAWALERFGEDVPAARGPLDEFLAHGKMDLGAIAADYRGALKRGQEEPLILALERHGTREMAEELLRAGGPRVRQAVERWARLRGYTIAPSPPPPSPPAKPAKPTPKSPRRGAARSRR